MGRLRATSGDLQWSHSRETVENVCERSCMGWTRSVEWHASMGPQSEDRGERRPPPAERVAQHGIRLMEPQSEDRGERAPIDRPRLQLPRSGLQWGHSPKTVENFFTVPLTTVSCRRWRRPFNGATVGRSVENLNAWTGKLNRSVTTGLQWSHSRGDRWRTSRTIGAGVESRRTVSLQWSHSRKTVENHADGRLLAPVRVRSQLLNGATVRRPWRTTCSVDGPNPTDSRLFNGATVRRPWRTKRQSATGCQLAHYPSDLQWSHSRETVENVTSATGCGER